MSIETIPELNKGAVWLPDLNDVAKFEAAGSGLRVKNLKVFRAGTFRDSMRRKKTWTSADLAAVVSNFKKLRSTSFPNVPVRMDHTRSVKDVGGYFEDLATDGKFIYADIIFTDAKAAQRYQEGTLRNRSFEIGPYIDNDDVITHPTALGLAFVDIGAVEGLYSQSDVNLLHEDTENKMPTTEEAAYYAQGLADAAAAHEAYHPAFFAAGLEAGQAAGSTATFTLATGPTTDPVVVQTYIAAVESQNANLLKAQEEASALARSTYVKGLVAEKKMAAPMAPGFEALVATLTDAQFAAFKGTWDAAPTNPLFASFGSPSNPDGGNGDDPQLIKIADAEEVIRNHRRAGMDEDALAKTPSYQYLKSLNKV